MGRFSAEIHGDDILLKLLPLQWNDYVLVSGKPDIRILLQLEDNLFSQKTGLITGWLRNNNAVVYIHKRKPIFALRYDSAEDTITVIVRQALDSYIWQAVFYGLLLGLIHNCIGLHGVTLSCADKIIILSAPSGTGKTTLSKLLEQCCNAKVINGDFALLSFFQDRVMFEPTPFCGTSRICCNQRVSVDRIIFLEQAGSEKTQWKPLSGRQAVEKIMSNSFVPLWDNKLYSAYQNSVIQLLSNVKTDMFSFTPDENAATVFYNGLFM